MLPQSPPGLKTLLPSLPDSAFECIISSAQPPAGPNSSSSIETCCFHLRSCYWEGANKVWILPWARLKSFIPLDEPKTGPRAKHAQDFSVACLQKTLRNPVSLIPAEAGRPLRKHPLCPVFFTHVDSAEHIIGRGSDQGSAEGDSNSFNEQ